LIAALFGIAIAASLVVALLAYRRGDSHKLLGALTVRVLLSVLFFALLLLAWWAGWIEPHGFAG
jgi:type IV secretory pathway TrbL component